MSLEALAAGVMGKLQGYAPQPLAMAQQQDPKSVIGLLEEQLKYYEAEVERIRRAIQFVERDPEGAEDFLRAFKAF